MIEFTQADVPAGGVVAGTFAWRPGEFTPASVIVVWLIWRLEVVEQGMIAKGEQALEDYTVVDKLHLVPDGGRSAFNFRIPEHGPVSYDGKLFRVIWEIVVGTQSPLSGPEPAAHAVFRVVARPPI